MHRSILVTSEPPEGGKNGSWLSLSRGEKSGVPVVNIPDTTEVSLPLLMLADPEGTVATEVVVQTLLVQSELVTICVLGTLISTIGLKLTSQS
jgi:hypothetical protein